MGQTVRERGTIGCLSQAAAGNGVKVMGSPHTALQIPLVTLMREGRCKQHPGKGWWGWGWSHSSPILLCCSPSLDTQLNLMVCSFSDVWPSAKFMWQHQQKEENEKTSKTEQGLLTFHWISIPLSPRKEERAKNKKIKEWDGKERLEKEKHLGYYFGSIKCFLKVRLNVLNSPFSGSSASSLPRRVAVPNSHLSWGCKDQPQARMLWYRTWAKVSLKYV